MKLFIPISFIVSLLMLQANEFPLLEPMSVEKAPLEHVVLKKVEPVIKNNIKKAPQENNSNQKTNMMLLKIKFQENSTNFTENSTQELEQFSNYLLKNKAYQVVIYSYTDSAGKKETNLKLSQERANNVIEVIENFGVSSTRLTAIGMGEKDPIAENNTQEGRETNRRIEALIIE